MLVSHKYQFIFLKTIKTASSSVFDFFTPFCLPAKKLKKENDDHYLKDKYIGFYKTGIVGNFEEKIHAKKRHVSCSEVKKILDNIDTKIWNTYFKFCVVRNPWDLCVSRFFWIEIALKKNDLTKNVRLKFKDMIEKAYDTFKNKNKDKYFAIEKPEEIYKLDGKYICDFHIKYENLKDDIKTVCEKCNIENYDLKNLLNLKSGIRDKSIHYSYYYNDYLKNIVAEIYKDDIEKFNYTFEKL